MIENLVTRTTYDKFRSQTTLAQYFAVNSRPNFCTTFQLFAPEGAKVEDTQSKIIKKAVSHLKERKEIGLDIVWLDIASAHVVGLSDMAFANAMAMKSQLRFTILLADWQKQGNIDHYGSARCH